MWKNGVTLLLLALLVWGVETGRCQDEPKGATLLFTVFDTTSAGSYAYLRDSVRGIITSRLAAKPGVAVLDRNLSEKELAAVKNRAPGGTGKAVADYLVSGELYGLKGGLNIQVAVYPLSQEKEVLRFEKMVKNQDNLLPELERLVGEIAQAVAPRRASDPAKEEKKATGSEGVAGFVTAHPEAAYKKGQYTGAVASAAGSSVQVIAKEGKRTLGVSEEILAFAVGDVDGDGEEEMVSLSGTTLELYRADGKKIIKAGGGKLPANLECHAMNLADLDGDGRQEMYLSCTSGLYVSSAIVQWRRGSSEFFVASANIPWYLRPVKLPGKGWRLVGQKRGGEKTDLLKPGVYLLQPQKDNGLAEGERLPLPPGVNLFDFVYADLEGDKAPELVAIDGKERLKVYSSSNELLWVSKNNYGGSKVYLGPSRAGAVNDQDRNNFTLDEDVKRQLIFVPGRLLVSDVDGNGREEVVVNQNSASVISFLEKMRIYKDGMIVGLAWDGEGLSESWRSGSFTGYLVGFSLVPKTPERSWIVSNKGSLEAALYVANLPRSGTLTGLLPGGGETQLTSYDLEFSTVKTK